MVKKAEILAYHGWGSQASFWKNFINVIPESIPFKSANRGYIGKAFHPRFDADTKYRVVFTHSFGLHWCNSGILSKADVLVIFNGFGDFFPNNPKLRKISESGLEAMIKGFEAKPEHTLTRFLENCLSPRALDWDPNIEDFNQKVLMEDLIALRNAKFPMIDLDFGSTMIAVDSGKDSILLEPRGETIIEPHYWKKFSKLFPKEGHALPFTNPEKCWQYLCSIIPIFEQYENNR